MEEGRVFKYEIPEPDYKNSRSYIREMPSNAKVLSVGMQSDTMVCWALVNTRTTVMGKMLIVANTGERIHLNPNSRFVGTVTSDFGIVWHIWEL